MKRYIGRRRHDGSLAVTVRIDDQPERDLDPRYDLRNHSPAGYETSYCGSGPAQLALAILADCIGDEAAQRVYQPYKRRVIANLPRDENWVLSETEVKNVAQDLIGGEGG